MVNLAAVEHDEASPACGDPSLHHLGVHPTQPVPVLDNDSPYRRIREKVPDLLPGAVHSPGGEDALVEPAIGGVVVNALPRRPPLQVHDDGIAGPNACVITLGLGISTGPVA